ncbi:M56 family metallopeptidase [Butyrivibrio sp. LB2008]|uniref:M56 family metallopeptidase n=1 Tax=Butyrivibrio sp. LB2008 TaxID=1408305 RepID=UPI0006846CED|nr:M56 family metallopeptidase [Butyrivibrio sp. LB2008]
MEQLFIGVLNNAITVSALIVAVVVVRAFGKKMPKWISCLLWMIVAVKLVVPIQFECVLSLIPSGKPIPANIVLEANPQISSGINGLDSFVNPMIRQNFAPDKSVSINPLQIFFHIGAIGWLTGMAVMLTYALITYILIRKRVSTSVKIDSMVYECDDISDSFILGTISPKVYIPSTLSDEARKYILKHEFAHLSRRDYVWKPLGFLILSVYWFNPLCWIAYILLCEDIEYACDEKVTKNIEKGEKAEYCRILLENSMPRTMISACPVTFGGTDVKKRIKNVVNYKRPAFWITTASIMVCVAVGVCFATGRDVKVESNEQKLQKAELENNIIASDGVIEPEKEVNENAVAEVVPVSADAENTNTSNPKDAEFTYNGNSVSIMDSFEAIDKALGGHDPSYSIKKSEQSLYSYGKNQEIGMILRNDSGTEFPVTISTREPVMTTSRGIAVGSSKDELIDAYGTPNGKHPTAYDGTTGRELTEEEYIQLFGESFIYDLGDYTISFYVDNDKVVSIEYRNNVNYNKFQWS